MSNQQPTQPISSEQEVNELKNQFSKLLAYQQAILDELGEINDHIRKIMFAFGILFFFAALTSILRACNGL